jgi:hypothetical protein
MDFYNPEPLPKEIPSLVALIPHATVVGIRRYVRWHIPPGGFLTAVLSNDLMEATGRADQGNAAAIVDIAKFVHNCIPAPCHGSRERVAKWLEIRVAMPEAV